MGLFSKKKTEDKKEAKNVSSKQVEKKPAVVKSGKKKAEKKSASMKDLYAEKTIEKAPKTKDGKKATRKYGQAYRVLHKPLITEKAANLGQENKYVFAVAPEANKIEIAKAINEVYGIKPTAVNIVKMHGKKVRTRRLVGQRKDWKKAIITLPEGKTIKVYEGV